MNRKENPGEAIDRIAGDIRHASVDPKIEEAAAARVWARLSGETAPAVPEEPGVPSNVVMIRGCAGYQALIPGYVSRELNEARSLLLEEHTHECVQCRKALAAAQAGRVLAASVPAAANHRFADGSRLALRAFVGLAAVAALAFVAAGVYRSGGFSWIPSGGVPASGEAARLGESEGTILLASNGPAIQFAEPLKTGRDSRAFIDLADGSRIEMKERSEISFSRRSDGVSIDLERGSVIIQAAKQHDGHLYVTTGDCTVSVVGTIFAVDSGTRGSRVSVIEGEVHVDQPGRRSVLLPGDQVATQASLSPVPLEQEIAWSRNAESHLAILHELTALRAEANRAIPAPGLRHSPRLLDLVPANTVVYAAIPNIAASLGEANRLVRDRIDQSDVLRQWLRSGPTGMTGSSSNAIPEIDEAIETIRGFGNRLGEEVVLSVTMNDSGDPSGLLLLSEVKDPAEFGQFLQGAVSGLNRRVRAGDSGKAPSFRLVTDLTALPSVDEPSTGEKNAPFGTEPGEFLLMIQGNVFGVSTSGAMLRSVGSALAAAASPAAGATITARTPFAATLANSYEDGAQWLFAVDMQRVMDSVIRQAGTSSPVTGASASDALSKAGFLDVRQLVVERKDDGSKKQDSAVLTFDKPRRGIASWLAAPAPMGSLEFISPDASVMAAFVTKEPVSLVEDLLAIGGGSDPEFAAHLAQFESEAGVSLHDDLAAPLGGEFAIALDGPVLPVPAWKLIMEVYDPARFQKTLESLVERFNSRMQEAADQFTGKLAILSEPANGRTDYTLSVPSSSLEVHYTFVDGYLLAAPSQILIDRTLSLRESKLTIGSSAKFLSLLPNDGRTNFSAIFYQNATGIAGPLASLVTRFAHDLSPEEKQSIESAGLELKPSLAYAYAEDDRILFAATSESSFGADLATLLGGALGIGHAGPGH